MAFSERLEFAREVFAEAEQAEAEPEGDDLEAGRFD